MSGAPPSHPELLGSRAGLPFLHSFASMLIGGAGRDAERVARHIVAVRARELETERVPRVLAVADERVAS